MNRSKTYTLPEGHAHATYDGSSWHLTAHPSNDPAAVDEACPLGGHSVRYALVVPTAYRDEAGFGGRDWRTEGAPDAIRTENPIGMDDQWPSLKAIAEAAIATAYQRVAFDRRFPLRTERPTIVSHPFSIHSNRPVCRVCKARAADHAYTEASSAYAAPGLPVADPVDAEPTEEDVLAAIAAARAETEADGTALTPDEARDLVGLWAEGSLPTGLVVMQFGYADVDDWVGLQEPEDVDDDRPLCLATEAPGAPIPAAFLAGFREQAEVRRLVDDGYTVGEAEAIVEHDAGDHDEESDPGCPRCAETHDPEPEERPWPEDYAALGIQRDTWACCMTGTRAEAEPLVFALVAEGREVRLARDPKDPERWHLAIRGGMAGPDGPALFLTNLRPGDLDRAETCSVAMDRAQHPRIASEEA